MNRSAVSEKAKVTTAVQEILRRWKNTSNLEPRKMSEEITMEYMHDLTGMGYSIRWRENVLRAALEGHNKFCHGRRHREGCSTFMARRRKRLTEKQTWFQLKHQEETSKKG